MSKVKYGEDIPHSISNKKTHQYIQRHAICIYDVDHDYILEKIMRLDHIANEKQIHNDNN